MRTRQLMDELRDSLGAGSGDGRAARSSAALPAVAGVGPSRSSGVTGVPQLPCGPAPADRELLERLKAATVAQIGVGRAGVRLRTKTLLKFLGDRAIAVEAVRSQLPADFAAKIGAVHVQSEARDLDEFLLRPDLGRRLAPGALEQIRARCAPSPDVQIVVGDGLSAHAVALNAPPLLAALEGELTRVGLRPGTPVLVERARMKTLATIGEATGARTAVIFLGERPGLGTGDGMSAYLVFRPRQDAMESDHEVVSNIHARGIPPAEAARKVADLLAEFVRTGSSGVPRQAGAGASAADRARVEPAGKGDALATRAVYDPKRLQDREPRATREPSDQRGSLRSAASAPPTPPLAVSAAARCAG